MNRQFVQIVYCKKRCVRHGHSVYTKSFGAQLDKDQTWCLKMSEKTAENFSISEKIYHCLEV